MQWLQKVIFQLILVSGIDKYAEDCFSVAEYNT